ncbi:hypothetical protein EUX98_g1259 [Antrodiella citrinella]|uniref:PIN domain-containing protein n=1 Tax=Antrodiella citrinella TaxID=2447956 RepID=A0A4S4N4V6_9APHY|nr:hypothetical protein EUX98_g1259 [Antrodiella citrinella]
MWAHSDPHIVGPTIGQSSSALPAVSSLFEIDDTLLHIAEVANQDVEMRDDFPVGTTYLVIDTNILIHQFDVVKRLSEDVEKHLLPIVIVIPNVVLTELDGLKKREELRWFAQTASTFMLAKVKERKSVKVQARIETLNIVASVADAFRRNDIKIFDCCCYFRTKGNVILASGDKNLCIECEKEQIRTISPPRRSWTSRDIAHTLIAYDVHGISPEQFHGHENASYRPAPSTSTSTLKRLTEGSVWQPDDDSMDIDEEYMTNGPAEDFIPSHALDALHWQVIDQFSQVLRDLANRLRSGTGHGEQPVRSAHAPWFHRLAFQEWTVEHCLAYFNYQLEQKGLRRLRESSPPIAVFLLRSSQNLHGRRGRRGQDWSRQDWINVANGLREVGERLDDGPAYVSVRALEMEMEVVFLVVLSSISYYLSIDAAAYLTEEEVDAPFAGERWNATEHGKIELIPRIIHQTWKSETLPPKWVNVSQGCRDMHPDYEYLLWTDATAREFIADQYSWFLDTYDEYTYPIQRADAIRYFVLYHYGGIYIDLDIGCLRPIDSLLTYPVILPRTNPVGVSNDLMFAQKGHPFMAQTIHHLVTFDHSWVLNYPTVMFSTGPMFLSAQYGLYTASHPPTPEHPGGEVRILPKSLYGKNAKPDEAPHSYFTHYYGSSWHADDAAFIGFLGKWGKILMWVGLAVLVFGVIRLALAPHSKQRRYSLRRIGGYEVMMPRWKTQNGRWHLDLGWFTLPASGSSTQPSSPLSLSSDEEGEDDVGLLPLTIDSRALPSTPSDMSLSEDPSSPTTSSSTPVVDIFRNAGSRIRSLVYGESTAYAPLPSQSQIRPRRSRGVLFFLPAFFTPSQGVELPQESLSLSRRTPSISVTEYPLDKASGLPTTDLTIYSRAGSSTSDGSTLC